MVSRWSHLPPKPRVDPIKKGANKKRHMTERIRGDGIRDTLAVRKADLAERLEAFRVASGWTIRDLARHLGEDDAYTGRLLRSKGSEMVSFYVADRLCTQVGVELPQVYQRAWIPVEE